MTEQAEHRPTNILLATDFSPRSDRAARRAILLAKHFGAKITVVHVVDDDQPARLVKRARTEAAHILDEVRRTAVEVDGVDCDTVVASGEAFAGIAETCARIGADLIVLGPHRRQILKDVFIGTTAERTIRQSSRPVLMVNGAPAGTYRSVLVATDMSEQSVAALRTCETLGLAGAAVVTLVHVFDTPARGLMHRASLPTEAEDDYVSEERQHADDEMKRFLAGHAFKPDRLVLRPQVRPVAAEIEAAADDCSADLIVVATHRRSGAANALLGSVTNQLLTNSARDVLAVPAIGD